MSNRNDFPNAPVSAEDDDEINLLDLLQVVVDNLRLLVLGPLAAGLLALGISFLVTPTFTGTTVFMPPQQAQSSASALLQGLGALGGIAGAAAGLKNPNDQFVALLKSNAVRDAIIDRFKLVERYEADFKTDVRKTLDAITKITAGKDGLITVEFDDKDPEFAAKVANAYVEELGKLLNRLAITEAQQRRLFFEKQLEQTKVNLTQAQQALQASGVNGDTFKTSAEASVKATAEMQAQIAAQEIKIGSMRGYLSENAPQFKQALTELSALRAQLAKLGAPPQGDTPQTSDYIARYRDFQYHATLFELFAKQYELARVDESREGAVIQVVDVATPPERKSKPKKALIAILTTLASGFALLLYVFIRNAWTNASQDEASAARIQALRFSLRRALGRR